MNKRVLMLLFFLLSCFLISPSVSKASEIALSSCTSSHYKVSASGKNLNCYTTYNEALNRMNSYTSKIGDVASISYGDKIVNSKYAFIRFNKSASSSISTLNILNSSLSFLSYVSPSSASDFLLLDYVQISGNWYYKVQISGLTGYVMAKYFDVIPFDSYDTIGTYYTVESNRLRHRYRTNYGNSYAELSLSYAPLYLKTGVKYYSFDGVYYYTDFTKLVDDNKNNVHTNAVNKTPYFDYFLYLPVRTKTEATDEDIDNYIVNGLKKTNTKIDKAAYYIYELLDNTVEIPALSECDSKTTTLEKFTCVNQTKFDWTQEQYQKAYTACNGNTTCQKNAFNNNIGDWIIFRLDGVTTLPYFVLDKSNPYDSIPSTQLDAYNNAMKACDAIKRTLYSVRQDCIFKVYKEYGLTGKDLYTSYGSQTMLANEGVAFIDMQNTKGVNALQALAVSITESGNGTSYLAITENNLFGIGAYDSNPLLATTYDSVGASIMGFGHLISRSYANSTGFYYNGSHLGNKGSGANVRYASDAYWGEKAAQHYATFTYNTDTNDYKKYKVGIKTSASSVPVKMLPNSGSTTLYNTTSREKIPFVILDTVTGTAINSNTTWYKVQTESSIVTNDVYNDSDYNFETSIGYIHSSYLYVEDEYPVISATNYSIYQGSSVNYKKNITAWDAWDGDLTSVITYKGTVDNKTVGSYNVTYSVTDSDGNVTNKQIVVNVIPKDSTAPTISAINKTVYIGDSLNLLSNVTATDILDGDITENLTVSPSSIDTKIAQEVDVTYSVTNSGGKTTTKTIRVIVSDKFTTKSGSFGFEMLKYNDTLKKIDIVGYLTILGINNNLATDIKYSLILVNQQTTEEHVVNLARLSTKSSIPYNITDSKYDYTYSWFSDSIDLSGVPAGDYDLYIRARGAGFEAKTLFREIFMKELNNKFDKKITINDRGYLFRRNYLDNNIPLELFIRDEGLVTTDNPPTIDNMFNSFYSMSLTNDKLNIKGTSHNVGADYSTKINVTREIIFENVLTFERYSYSVGYTDQGDYKVTLNVSDGFDKTRAWFNASNLDLSTLPKGTYSILIHTNNGKVNDSGELTDIFYKTLPKATTYNDRTYTISRNADKRLRLELKIDE